MFECFNSRLLNARFYKLINSKRKINMNKSKIISAATGLATVLSATAATADGVSVNGYIEGWFSSGDKVQGMSNTMWSNSVYVSYSSTLDNGMGLSVGYTITGSSVSGGFGVDTGMGTLRTGSGYQVNSAADGMDGLPNNANVKFPNAMYVLGTYDDGDSATGEGIKYTSPSMGGWTFAASLGENACSSVVTYAATDADNTTVTTCDADRNSAIAVSGSIAGVALAAGAVDDNDGSDDNFMTVGYSVAGVSMGYGVYDDDAGSESTIIGLNTSMAGLSLGYTFEDLDATTDKDASVYSIGKDLGGMNVTLQYTDIDDGTAIDNQAWNVVYSVGF